MGLLKLLVGDERLSEFQREVFPDIGFQSIHSILTDGLLREFRDLARSILGREFEVKRITSEGHEAGTNYRIGLIEVFLNNYFRYDRYSSEADEKSKDEANKTWVYLGYLGFSEESLAEVLARFLYVYASYTLEELGHLVVGEIPENRKAAQIERLLSLINTITENVVAGLSDHSSDYFIQYSLERFVTASRLAEGILKVEQWADSRHGEGASLRFRPFYSKHFYDDYNYGPEIELFTLIELMYPSLKDDGRAQSLRKTFEQTNILNILEKVIRKFSNKNYRRKYIRKLKNKPSNFAEGKGNWLRELKLGLPQLPELNEYLDLLPSSLLRRLDKLTRIWGGLMSIAGNYLNEFWWGFLINHYLGEKKIFEIAALNALLYDGIPTTPALEITFHTPKGGSDSRIDQEVDGIAYVDGDALERALGCLTRSQIHRLNKRPLICLVEITTRSGKRNLKGKLGRLMEFLTKVPEEFAEDMAVMFIYPLGRHPNIVEEFLLDYGHSLDHQIIFKADLHKFFFREERTKLYRKMLEKRINQQASSDDSVPNLTSSP